MRGIVCEFSQAAVSTFVADTLLSFSSIIFLTSLEGKQYMKYN